MMERCSNCQAELEEGAARCAVCGQAREKGELPEQALEEAQPETTLARCPACGREQAAWSRFCRDCGYPLRAEEAQDTPVLSGEVIFVPAPEEQQEAVAEELLTLARSDAAGAAGASFEFPSGAVMGAPPGAPGFPGGLAPWQGMPGFASQPPPPKPRKPRFAWRKRLTPKVIAAVVAAMVVLTGLSGAAYVFTRPRPVIEVTSAQHVGSLLAGSPDTDLHVSGQDFTANSAISFLLDGKAASGAPKVTSDQHGNILAILTITDDWSFNTHMLTARDAKGYATKDGVRLEVLPQPVLTIGSDYMVDTTPAGAQGTVFFITGKRFAPQAAVTLLLDGKPLTLAQPLSSDAKGRISINLPVAASWTLGGHVLTAQDTKGYVTQSASALVIVPQGEAGTPGPNGAPADDASFSIYMNVKAIDVNTGQKFSFQVYADVTGRPDPAGGTVCNLAYDNGKSFTTTGKFPNGEKYTETTTYSCSGTYKDGKIRYIETATSDQFKLANGGSCSTRQHHIINELVGTFTTKGFSGAYLADGAVIPCNNGTEIIYDPLVGTWTGIM